MLKFFGCENKFDTVVDKSRKEIYNKIGMICRAVLCVMIILSVAVCSIPSGASLCEDGREAFYLSASKAACGEVTVVLGLKEGFRVSGFLAEVHFDGNELSFLNAQLFKAVADKGFCLSLREEKDTLSLLFDGVQAISGEDLIFLKFKRKGGGTTGFAEVKISVSEACLLENNAIFFLPKCNLEVAVSQASLPLADHRRFLK